MPKQSNETKNIFGIFINLLGFISAILYFSGWIYRLAYYRRFEINIMELNFSFESYLLIPVTAFFSSLIHFVLTTALWKIFLGLTLILALMIGILILYKQKIKPYLSLLPINPELSSTWKTLYKYNLVELLLLLIISLSFFSTAWIKGYFDGFRDIQDQTSLLPKVTLLSEKNILQTINSNNWRLLLRQDDWIYLVATKTQEKPKVLMLSKGESGDKALILAPDSV